MMGQYIKCKHIPNILYVLHSSCVNLVESRGFLPHLNTHILHNLVVAYVDIRTILSKYFKSNNNPSLASFIQLAMTAEAVRFEPFH
jgi:hypothetical protein